MSWATRIEQQHLDLCYYIKVEGIDVIAANFPLPASWGSGGQVTEGANVYRWREVLHLGDELAAVGQELEPWAGVGQGGGLSLTLDMDSVIAALFERSVDDAILDATLSTTASSATFDTTDFLDSSGWLYAGKETLKYTGKTSTTLTGLSRGYFGSRPTEHVAEYDQAVETGAGGPRCANVPVAWSGRVLKLYGVPGYRYGGVFHPYSSSMGTEDKVLFFGPLVATQRDLVEGTVTLECGDPIRALESSVASRLPTGYLGHGTTQIYIGPDNEYISYLVEYDSTGTVPHNGETQVKLQRDDGTGTAQDVPEGLYWPSAVAEILAFTMNQSYSYSFGVGLLIEDDKWRMSVTTSVTAVSWFHIVIDSDNSFWLELGFNENLTSEKLTVPSGSRGWWEIAPAQRSRPVWRIPYGSTGRRIYFRPRGALAWQKPTDHGWTYADGTTPIPSYVLVDEEIFRWSNITDAGEHSYLHVDARAVLGTVASEIYIETGDEEEEEITQIIAAERVEWPWFMQYLLASNGFEVGYGGWRGSGIGMDPDHFDGGSLITMLSSGPNRIVDMAITQPTPLVDILSGLLVLAQSWVGSRDGQIYFDDLRFPLEHEAAVTPLILDEDNTALGQGAIYDAREDGVVNVVAAEGMNYDPGADKGDTLTWKDGTSIGTYGEMDAVTIDFRYVPGTATEQRAELLSASQRISARFGSPWITVDLAVTNPVEAWGGQLGDPVRVDRVEISDEPLDGVIIGAHPVYKHKDEGIFGRLRVAVWRNDGRRTGGYSPCLLSTSQAGEALYLAANVYTETGNDTDFFAAGDAVRIYEEGDESTAITTTIKGVNASQVSVLTSSFPTGSRIIIEADVYGSCSDTQKRFVFLSSGGRRLGSDGAYYLA